MILQREIIDKAQEWKVPPDTVDKDYVLGHFLSAFVAHYPHQLIFKGGTCLRKCYFENYRFSEDLDFTASDKNFVLEQKTVNEIAEMATKNTGILFDVGKLKPIVSDDKPKGFQIFIKYWGANHSKNQRPLPPNRWHTKIKLEISTDEIVILPIANRSIIHLYSDKLTGSETSDCYNLTEVISEKLRALKQRSYTAPRDFYDLYYLTQNFTNENWKEVIPVFLEKMKHKKLEYTSPGDLINERKLMNVKRVWESSVAHQITEEHQPEADEIITSVAQQIKKYLCNNE